ncbi:hypothetical protein [Caulobacter sp. X]|uniref:hypothetical protein n=1 Tax=Caulobacter sp. X TaxID=2048901 RepID=UPI000C15486E|nr:hypothetical protein [Caulobacter sp. X]PIB96015.1 hypothetical protein CSW60_15780 [Caulobacter sp. X]
MLPVSLAVLLALNAAGSAAGSPPFDATAAGRVAFGEVCLKAVAEGRPVADLAQAAAMEPVTPTTVGATLNDKAWKVGRIQPAHVVAWTDGGCTASVDRGDPAALSAMARAAILARPEGFRAGVSGLYDGERVERSIYCAERKGRWIVASITVPGPKANGRTRALSSSAYSRPTPSNLCRPG